MKNELIKPFWKQFPDEDTEILEVFGVQVASLQPSEDYGNNDKDYEIYIYDSDFQELFQERLMGWETKDRQTLKSVVEEIFLKWIDKCFKELGGSLTLAE